MKSTIAKYARGSTGLRRPPSTAVPARRSTPRARLEALAAGAAQLETGDLQSLLAAHAVKLDDQSHNLSERFNSMVEMLFTAGADDNIDPSAAIKLISVLGRLQRSQLCELRRTIELLHRLSRPERPTFKIEASGSQMNFATAQQVTGPRSI